MSLPDPTAFAPPFRAEKHPSGWWVVVDSEGNPLDESGDGGFLKSTATMVANSLNNPNGSTPVTRPSASSALSNKAIAAGAAAFFRHHRDTCYPEAMSGEAEHAACDIYDAIVAADTPPPLTHLERFPMCAPGDSQEDVWILRFDDADGRDCIFRGPDAETQARAKWEEMCGPSGSWNGYLFQLARHEPQPADATLAAAERVRTFLAAASKSSSFRADQIASIGHDPLLQSDLQLLVDAIAKRAAHD